MGYRLICLGSGSTGNCSLLGSNHKYIMIDGGLSLRSIIPRLNSEQIDLCHIKALLITHTHGDHIKYALNIAHRLSIPIYATRQIARSLLEHSSVNQKYQCVEISTATPFSVADFVVEAFNVPHDSANNVGFYIQKENHALVWTTDIGHVTEKMLSYYQRGDTVVIESNYDEQMLRTGGYPQYLQERIEGDYGHLSNIDCGSIIKQLTQDNLKNIFLSHLSDNNNTPQIALKEAQGHLPNPMIKLNTLPPTHNWERSVHTFDL